MSTPMQLVHRDVAEQIGELSSLISERVPSEYRERVAASVQRIIKAAVELPQCQERYTKARRWVVERERWLNERYPDWPLWRFEEAMSDVWAAETRARMAVSDREMLIDGKEPYVRARLAAHGEHVR